MLAKRTLPFLAALALVALFPAASDASLAKRLGGSGYSGILSSNPSTRTQQLTADPVSVLRGSTSTEYDPSVVSLKSVISLPGFFVTDVFVGITHGHGGEDLVSLGAYLEGEGTETGYLQVFYQKESEPSFESLTTEDGYTVVDSDGDPTGDKTHQILFDYLPSSNTVVAKYRLYADNGERGTEQDGLVSVDDPDFFITDISEANVQGALIPLPAAAGPGLIGLALVGLVKKLRGRRAVA